MQEHRNSSLILEVNLQLLRADGQLTQGMNLKPSRLTRLLQTLKHYQVHKKKKIPTCSQSEVSSDLDPTYSGLSPDKAVNIKLSQWIYHRVHAPSFLNKKLSEQSKITKNNKNPNEITVSASLIKLGIKLILPCPTATQLYQRCGSSFNKNGNQS